jgi:centrosomal protein CEP250
MERKVTELQELNNQQSSQIFELESELAEVMQKLVHVQTSRDQMEVELAEMSAVISGFEEMQNDCQSWKERFLAIKAETSQRISELQNQLASDRDSFEKELCLLNDIVDQEKADREQVMTGLSEMQGRYNEQSEQIIALQKSKDAADADISNLREQLARSNQEHQKLLCESKAAQQRLDLTITDLDGIKSSLSSKQHEVESLERALALKQDLVRDQQQSLDALADAIQQHKNDLAEKSTELTRERQETVQLKDALARLTAELNARWNQRRQDSTTQTQANDSEEEEAAERILMKLQLEEMQRRAQILEAERADLLVTMDGAEIKSKQTLDILRAELEQVSQNYSHFESLAGELHQANEELRQSLDAAQDQNESMRRQLAILQTMRDEAQLDSRRYQELVSQSELKIAQLTDTIQELELRGAYQDKSMEMSRQNQQQLQAMEKTLQELNADRQSLEKSRKQYKKYALSLEHKVADKEQQIEQLTSRYEICAKEVARLQQDSIEKESETQSLTKRLAEAAVALKEDAAGPLKESDLDFDSTARDFEFSKQVTPDNTKARSEALLEKLVLPDGVDKQRIEKVLRSISHLSIPEIVCRYESKLHKLHVWVEKGEKELSSGVQMIMMKSRTKRV